MCIRSNGLDFFCWKGDGGAREAMRAWKAGGVVGGGGGREGIGEGGERGRERGVERSDVKKGLERLFRKWTVNGSRWVWRSSWMNKNEQNGSAEIQRS